MYIIKPDAFWEKRRSGTGLKKEQLSVVFEVITVKPRLAQDLFM